MFDLTTRELVSHLITVFTACASLLMVYLQNRRNGARDATEAGPSDAAPAPRETRPPREARPDRSVPGATVAVRVLEEEVRRLRKELAAVSGRTTGELARRKAALLPRCSALASYLRGVRLTFALGAVAAVANLALWVIEVYLHRDNTMGILGGMLSVAVIMGVFMALGNHQSPAEEECDQLTAELDRLDKVDSQPHDPPAAA